jgi:hypothetical protein
VKDNSIELPLGIFFTRKNDKNKENITTEKCASLLIYTVEFLYASIKNTNIHQNVKFYPYLVAPSLSLAGFMITPNLYIQTCKNLIFDDFLDLANHCTSVSSFNFRQNCNICCHLLLAQLRG